MAETAAPTDLLRRAAELARTGRFAEAEQGFRSLLASDGKHAEANFQLGVLLARTHRPRDAIVPLKTAIESDVRNLLYWAVYAETLADAGLNSNARDVLDQARNAGVNSSRLDAVARRLIPAASGDPLQMYQAAVGHQQRGEFAEAVSAYQALIARVPNLPEAYFNLGAALGELGRAEEGLQACARGLALKPDVAEGHLNMGNLYLGTDRPEQAEASFRKATGLKPGFADAHHSLGLALFRQDKAEEALPHFSKALAIAPRHIPAHRHRAIALTRLGRTAEAFAVFTRHAHLVHAKPDAAPSSPHKARHDEEQRAWQAAAGIAPPPGLHLEGGARLAGPAVNPPQPQVAAAWENGDPQLVTIDGLLTPDALAALRRFCWGSTIWRKSYDDGYLGALPESGFSVPLIVQISEELRAAYPGIFGDRPLLQAWGFKYDSSMRGIRLHADSAAVNVNFWITPDTANLDPDSGGLVVWDKAAPLHWDFARFNGNEMGARDFLAKAGARPVTVPYRDNRAVIFDSDLFHQTDKIRFRGGYENRRINITLLYGWRDKH